jgi:zinc protease
VHTAVATPVAAAAAREVLGELERIVAEPVEAAELEDAQSYIVGTFPYTLQTVSGLVDRLESIALYDLPGDYYDTLPQVVRSVTADDVQRVAREHLHPYDLVVVAVGPSAELEPAFTDLG